MAESKNTWVIGISDDLGIKKPSKELSDPMRNKPRPVSRPIATRPTLRPQPKPVAKPIPPKQLHYALLIGLTYLLGPFALLLTEQGRKGRGWLATGCVAGLSGLGLFIWRGDILAKMGSAGWSLVLLGLGVSLVLLLGFSAWARAIVLTRDSDPAARASRRKSIPAWLQKTWVLGGLGFLAPGFGLLLAGRARKAAGVIWACKFGLLALLVLFYSPLIWEMKTSLELGIQGSGRVETIFFGAVLTCVLFTLAWVGQGLEGIRQAIKSPRISSRFRRSYYALGFVTSWVVLGLSFNSGGIAQNLHEHGQQLREAGLKVIPLNLSLAAYRCDSSRVIYAVQAVELYSELGQVEKAGLLRSDLDQNLNDFVEFVRLENLPPETTDEPLLGEPVSPVRIDQVFAANIEPLNVQTSDRETVDIPVNSSVQDTVPNPGALHKVQQREKNRQAFQKAFFGAMLLPDPE